LQPIAKCPGMSYGSNDTFGDFLDYSVQTLWSLIGLQATVVAGAGVSGFLYIGHLEEFVEIFFRTSRIIKQTRSSDFKIYFSLVVSILWPLVRVRLSVGMSQSAPWLTQLQSRVWIHYSLQSSSLI